MNTPSYRCWSKCLICLLVVGAALAIGGYLLSSESEPRTIDRDRADTKTAPLPTRLSANEGTPGQSKVAAPAVQASSASFAEVRRNLANSPNPYAMVVTLYTRGHPGDFALVREVMNECLRAFQHVHFAKELGLLAGNTSSVPRLTARVKRSAPETDITPAVHSQRIAALQAIESRCGPLGQANNYFFPSPTDTYGKLIHPWEENSRVEVGDEQLLDAYKAQGAAVTNSRLQAAIIKQHIDEFPSFTSEEQLSGLLHLVAYASQMDPEMPGNSLRALSECVGNGWCGKKVEELDLSFYGLPLGSPQHAKALEMLPRLRALFRM